MKLKDPLMGIKLMQGHIVMHLTCSLYIAIFIEDVLDITGRNATFGEYEHIWLLKYGHFVVALMQTLQTFLKIYHRRFLADSM